LIMSVQMLLEDIDAGELDFRMAVEELREIENDARRCKKITQKLLNFSRRVPEERKRLGINTVIEDALLLVQRQAELERERLEQERIERELREEQERIEREQQQRAEQLNNMGRDAFGRQGVGETEGSEGITEGSGNQGVTNGSPDADRYDTGGGLGDGISFGGLGSRSGNLPKPDMAGCDITQKIEVKVEIQVDKDGKVISAIVTNATYQNKCIWDMVVEAAKKSRFSADQGASFRQTGWIKYIIVP